MKYLLSFSIGPVQPFIQTARRAQDLWLGSRLLSDLMRAGIVEIQNKVELVFPDAAALERAKEKSRLSHKFLAVCDDPETIARTVQIAIEKHWQERANRVREYLQKNLSTDALETWERQVKTENLLEFYWAAVPYTENDHQVAYNQVGRILAARKTIRNFVQISEPGFKCKLCGERQGLPGRLSRNPAKQKPGEALCAVCAVKRFDAEAQGQVGSEEVEPFPSTSTAAIAPFLENLLELLEQHPAIRLYRSAFEKALQELEAEHPASKLTRSAHPESIPGLKNKGEISIRRLDGDLYFPDTFEVKGRLKNDYGFEAKPHLGEKVKHAVETLNSLREAIKQEAGLSPNPYFALLVMDGDRMGQRLSEIKSKSEHQEFSHKLFEFTNEVEQIVEKHLGRLIFAGGDDVVALLPAIAALPAAAEIHQAFGAKLINFTMSAGIAIAHHLAPLQITHNAAREAEKLAKNRYDRKALCVTLLKRSGAPLTVGARWHSGMIDLLADVTACFKNNTLSTKVVFDISQVTPALGKKLRLREARIAEIRRLLRRHRAPNCDDDTKEKIDSFADHLIELAEHCHKQVFNAKDDLPRTGMDEMADWLKLARFLAGGGRDA